MVEMNLELFSCRARPVISRVMPKTSFGWLFLKMQFWYFPVFGVAVAFLKMQFWHFPFFWMAVAFLEMHFWHFPVFLGGCGFSENVILAFSGFVRWSWLF